MMLGLPNSCKEDGETEKGESCPTHLPTPDHPEPLRLQELEPPRRYRPESLAQLCTETGWLEGCLMIKFATCRFTPSEMKRLYRGFKTECPTGVLRLGGSYHFIEQ